MTDERPDVPHGSGPHPFDRGPAPGRPAGGHEPGAHLGDLVLERRLGEGGAGVVWLARNRYTNQVFAVKICAAPEMRQLLLDEARTFGQLMSAARLSHFPGSIVRLLETHLGHEPPFLVMEYVAGGDLRARLRREGRLGERAVVDILCQVLEALEFIHDLGLTHRDIKPENILLDAEGRARVTDFGLGRVVTENLLSVQRSIATRANSQHDISGTLDYMAPEQLEGRSATPATDMYALGVVMFELLTGERPRGLTSPTRRRPGIRAGWDELFRRTYAHDVADRFPGAAAFRAALVEHFGDLVPDLPGFGTAATGRADEADIEKGHAGDVPPTSATPSPGRVRRTDDEPRLAQLSSTLAPEEKLRRYFGYRMFGCILPAAIWTYLCYLGVVAASSPVVVVDGVVRQVKVGGRGMIDGGALLALASGIWLYAWLLYVVFAQWRRMPRASKALASTACLALTLLAVPGLMWLCVHVGVVDVIVAVSLHALFLGDVKAKLAGRRGLWRPAPSDARERVVNAA